MNQLKNASSPYLLQHADNPVNWKEWSSEMLEKAEKENKLLLISIGYAACHWCHVMERECFKDEEVARVMNQYFICIKVDREERPDIDKIYMDAAQIINKQAGWPLNAFALPDGRPFFAGTYFPKDNWLEILEKIAEVQAQSPDKLTETADQVQQGLNSINIGRFKTDKEKVQHFDLSRYRDIGENWSNYVDFRLGGFKRAPKFPFPAFWSFLLQYHQLTDDKDALRATLNTLDQMLEGGIYDHLGGGFARYAVDEHWKVPHFEKMLYDNAQLISLMADAYKLSKNKKYKEAIHLTVDFLDNELKAKDEAYCSSLNADSEGEEGKFYVWTKQEIRNALNDEELLVFRELYSISENGNWESGKNILHVHKRTEQLAKDMHKSVEDVEDLLRSARSKLKKKRDERIRPSCDDKQLTSWNALLIKGFTDAFQALADEKYRKKAKELTDLLIKNLMDESGFVYRNFKNGKASISGFMDDHALLINALINVYQISFDINYLYKAKEITETTIELFLDKDLELFAYRSKTSDGLIATSYEVDDNVIPSSNAVMAENLIDLAAYFDRKDYRDIASNMLEKMREELKSFSPNVSRWMEVWGKMGHTALDIAITGDKARQKADELQKNYWPLARYCGGPEEDLSLLKGKVSSGKDLIYVCKNNTCTAPTDKIDEAVNQINE